MSTKAKRKPGPAFTDEQLEERMLKKIRQRCHEQVEQAQARMREQRRTAGVWGGLLP